MVSQHFVELTLTAAGTVEAFDASRFKARLAASVGVTPADISLAVAAASVRVVATIRVAAAAAATGVASTLQVDPSALSELVGVTVLSASAPVVLVRLVPVAPPPALPPARELPETEQAQWGDRLEGGALVALAAGAPIGLLLCAAIAACVWRRRLRAAAPTRWGASPQPSGVDLTCKAAVRGAGGNDDSLPPSEPRGG